MKKKQPKCVPFEKKVLFLCEYNSVVSVYVSGMEINNATITKQYSNSKN